MAKDRQKMKRQQFLDGKFSERLDPDPGLVCHERLNSDPVCLERYQYS